MNTYVDVLVICSICYLFMYILSLKVRKTVMDRLLRSPLIKPGKEMYGHFSAQTKRILFVIAHPDD